MELKTYQTQSLDVLGRYLAEARVTGPANAYHAITGSDEQQFRLRGFLGPYRPLNGLAETPYVCLRLPTGGGKTILAAHGVAVAKENWIEKDYPLVLWLVTSTTIRKQTVEALKNPLHPYRQALDASFDGRVRVFDIADFGNITPHDLTANCCIVVGTIQALRVNNTEGRKVYAHSEALEPHFSAIPRHREGLERIEEGKTGAGTIRFSFANLLHLHRPLMIVDEAHRAVTDLSQEMQRRVNPSAIIEFTATPRANSNLLHSVSAQELKEAEMIKLPVMLAEHPTWQQAVDGAVAKQAELEAVASKDKRYIRPLVLFQAQDKNQEANVDALKAYLIETGIAEQRIRIATGDQRELDDLDLFDPACGVDFIITVQALKEGWDCSFAYIFCSLANISSATDAEQLLGRVLRMPYAERRSDERLNRAYAHLTSPRFAEAALALKDKMVSMGFDEEEAERNIIAQQPGLDNGLWGEQSKPEPSVVVAIEADSAALEAMRSAAPTKIAFVPAEQGKGLAVKLSGFLTPDEKQKIEAALPALQAKVFREAVVSHEAQHADKMYPAVKGASFTVPALMAQVQGELELADTDLLMEHSAWSLTDHPVRLAAGEFALIQTANTFSIDLDGRHLSIKNEAPQSTQTAFDVDVAGWSETGLARFLAKQLRQPDLSPSDLLAWCVHAVDHLANERNFPIAGLMQSKFILARKLQDRIGLIRKEVRRQVYQTSLFGPEAKPQVSYDQGFTFRDGVFADVARYHGGFTFTKHFTGAGNVPAFDGKEGGEEETCAMAIDSLPENTVTFWLRNVAQHRDAFRLPLAHGYFYPDFIAQLTDGRLAVIEYKGDHLLSDPDTKEKIAVGELWAQASDGKGVFLLVRKNLDGLGPRDQMLAKLGGH